MKCPICKHGSTHTGYASITLERDDATLVFKHVPAEICDNCGEEYVSEEAGQPCGFRGGSGGCAGIPGCLNSAPGPQWIRF